jgi:hypothetical protein
VFGALWWGGDLGVLFTGMRRGGATRGLLVVVGGLMGACGWWIGAC